MTERKKKSSIPLLSIVVVLFVALFWYGSASGGWFSSDEEEVVQGAEVRRGPLRISVNQRGNLEAKDSVVLRSEVEGRNTILWLIKEGAQVQAGDVVARLDSSEVEDRKVSQEITVENARASYVKAQQVLEIQKSQNTSDIAKSEQDLEFANADLRKYLEGDWPQQLQQAEESIVLAEEELAQSRDRLEWSTRLEKDGFLTRTELEKDELANQRNEILLEQSKRAKELLEKYDYPKQKAQLTAAVEERQRELERVKLTAEARLVDYTSDVNTAKARFELEEEKLAKWIRQIDKSVITTPAGGMVVYGLEDGGWGGRGGDPIQEGVEVRERQEIVTIPQAKGMVVEASLHESVLKKVNVGLPVLIEIDALPGKQFQGHVEYIAQLPDKGSWWANPDQRLYKTEISVASGDPEMRPGMSCNVEIIIDDIPDALFVPVQAVHYSGGKTIAFLAGDKEQPIQVGQSSDKFVQVLSGLSEGDDVMLSPPAGFVPEVAPDNREGFNQLATKEVTADSQAEKRNGKGDAANANGGGGSGATDWTKMSAEDRKKAMERYNNMSDDEKKELMEKYRSQGGGGQTAGRPSADEDAGTK